MGSNLTEWKTYIQNDLIITPEGIKKGKTLDRISVKDHPLKNVTVTERIPRRILGSQPSTGRTTPTTPASILEPLSLALNGLDPLTEFALQEMDPLSKMAAEMETSGSKINTEKPINDNMNSGMQPWNARKQGILSKFTTSEKISIVTSFLSEDDKVIVKAQSTAVDKIQHRLEQLDYFEEGSQKKFELSQAEYVARIKQLNKELENAWQSQQRVKALKIAIQCAKLLADTDVLAFYPSKFVLVTDILDIFGQLVYERLRTKAEYVKPGSKIPTALPEDFTLEMVPETAKETCLNWFYKIASIRELVPRIYVEMALLKSYNFISNTEVSDALLRITDMINGIGNPLVAVYARCYLSRSGLMVTPKSHSNKYLFNNFTRFLESYPQLFSRSVKTDTIKQKVLKSTYMTLYTPALDFILATIACDANENILNDLLNRATTLGNSSLILNTIMSGFKPSFISDRTLQFLDMIGKCHDDGLPLHILLRTLGLCITICPPPGEQRRQILTIVWRHIATLKKPDEYISCAEAWVQFVVQNFATREINMVFGDIIDHLTPNRAYENHYKELKIVIQKVLSQIQDFELLLVMDNFLRLVDLFQQESTRVEACKNILTQSNSDLKTNDPVVTNALMFLCGVLHDSVNALTPEDELKQIGDILCNIIRRVDYGRDFEQQLGFYVEARGAFSNIDAVLAQLVLCVNSLSVTTRQIIKGMHTRKTGDFVRACAAYCFITVPSIVCVKTRLKLYLLSGRVALFNECLGQADACFKAAFSIIPELQDDNGKCEIFLVPYIKEFLSTLVVVPDNPERGVLSLTRILLNVLRSFEWNKQNGSLTSIYISVIDMMSTMNQEIYPYHVDKVESNDSMYGSDPKFISEVNNICSILIGEILGQLKEMGPCRKQSQLATELFIRVVTRGDLNSANRITLALNLWQLSIKNGYADVKYMRRTKNYFQRVAGLKNNKILMQLVEKLNLPQ